MALVGMSGCGKTTVGGFLSERFGLPFFDSDHEVEQEASMSVTELFSRYGEVGFRSRERAVLARILGGDTCLVATGGGAYVDCQTASILDAGALTVWLDVSVDTIVGNIGSDRSRPLLSEESGDLRARVTAMLAERRACYARAEVRVGADGMTVPEIAASIASKLAVVGVRE